MKRIIAIALLLVLVCCGCGRETGLGILILKCGKADAIILYTKDYAMLIDAGEDDDGDKVLEAAAKRGIERFDCMVITHYDKDHVGGAAEVLDGIEVGQIIEPGYPKQSDEFAAFEAAAERNGVKREKLVFNKPITLGRASFQLFYPEKEQYEDENDHSIVVRVSYGEYDALFTGDALDERMAELNEYNLSSDILKVPHHGSFEEGSRELFERVSPDYAVITCSEKNPADERTIEALKEVGAEVYITAYQDIEFIIDEGGGILEVLPISPESRK